MDKMDRIAESLRRIDWNDIDAVELNCRDSLNELAAEPGIVRACLNDLLNRPELLSMCEHYDILDKIVLYSDDDPGVRIRLHVFLPGYFDRPHNHRWSYASKILRGHYRHYCSATPSWTSG